MLVSFVLSFIKIWSWHYLEDYMKNRCKLFSVGLISPKADVFNAHTYAWTYAFKGSLWKRADTIAMWHISSEGRSTRHFLRQWSIVQFETPQGRKIVLADRCDNEPVRHVRSSAVASEDWAGYLKASKMDTYFQATCIQPRCIE